MLEPGQPVPAFTLPDQDGHDVSSEDLRGGWSVVYFYPKAGTSGCTTQACGIRDRAEDYAARDARVLGVSPDPVALVKRFHAEQGLSFTLLADEDHAVCERFGTWQQKQMYGRTYMGATRSTFVLDPGAVVREVLPEVQPKQHDDRVLRALDALQSTGS